MTEREMRHCKCFLAYICLVLGTHFGGCSDPRSAIRPHRIPWPTRYFMRPQGLYNPAAVYDHEEGWVLMLRHDQCFFRICGVHGTNTSLFISKMGTRKEAPDLRIGANSIERWTFHEPSFQMLKQKNGASKIALGDFRPFVYNGIVFASFWVRFGYDAPQPSEGHRDDCWGVGVSTIPNDYHSCDITILGLLDFDRKELRAVQHLIPPKQMISETPMPEKNWAFLEHKGEMIVIYSLFPCTIVLRVDHRNTGETSFMFSICYNDPKIVKENTSLKMSASRLSGHPCLWMHEDNVAYLFMVHTRAEEGSRNIYQNWGVVVSGATLQVTHISAGPILNSDNFLVEEYYPGTLVVGSYHIIKPSADDSHPGILRMFLGEGDKYPAYQDVSMQDIKWWALDPDARQTIEAVGNLRKWWIDNVEGSTIA